MNHPCFTVRRELRDASGNVYCPGLTYTAATIHLIRLAEAWVMQEQADWVVPGNPGRTQGRGAAH